MDQVKHKLLLNFMPVSSFAVQLKELVASRGNSGDSLLNEVEQDSFGPPPLPFLQLFVLHAGGILQS